MNLQELDSFKMSDAVKFHNELNPNLWYGSRLRPEVKKQLKKIADDFLDELGISGLDVLDLTVSGSNAAYSYTPHSDLDLHILIDMNELPNDEVYRELFNAKKNIYNDSHNIKIHGVPVELYVQDTNEPVISLGEYSILQDKWLKLPSKRRANLDQNSAKAKYEKLHQLIQHALKSKNVKAVNNVIKKIRQYRQAGLDSGGEFGPENLAYKALRNQDYITKLYDLRDKLHSEELTIETMYGQPKHNKLLNRPTLSARMLAAKHNVSVGHIITQLRKGIEVEKKHTTYGQTAREIALDHLADDPNYYAKLHKANLEEEKYDDLPDRVYHVTPSENLDNIMRKGLVPQTGDRSRKIVGEKAAIYCFPDKNSMEDAVMNWLGDEFDEDEQLALLEIDTTGLDGQVTDGAEYEVAITSIIPPQNIRILSKDLATPMTESIRKKKSQYKTTDEDWHPNATPPGPEFKPTMPKGTVKVDVSDVYDWYKLGQHISNLDGLGKHDFGQGPPSTILAFGDEDTEHKYIDALKKTGLTTTDIDPVDPKQPKNMPRQKVDPTYNVSEAFNQPYPIKWEKGDHGDLDALATLPDGSPLSIMFNQQQDDDGDEITQVQFYRNNSQEVTGEGDAQRIFATVLTAIQQYIKKRKPIRLTFAASKQIDPSIMYGPDDPQPNPESRAKLYDRLVQRYAKAWGYRAFRADNGDLVMYELSRINKKVAETGTMQYAAEKTPVVSPYAGLKDNQYRGSISEASGYIPSEKEKNDPRFKTALTVDVKPDSIKKNAKAFSSKVSRAGIPPTLNPSGKF